MYTEQTKLGTDDKDEWNPNYEIPSAWMPFAKDMASQGVLVGFPR